MTVSPTLLTHLLVNDSESYTSPAHLPATLIENLTHDAIALLYVMKLSTISLNLTLRHIELCNSVISHILVQGKSTKLF